MFHATPKPRTLLPLGRPIVPTLALVLTFGAHRDAMPDERPSAEEGAQDASEDWFRPEADPRALKRLLEDTHVSDRWIYHDLDAARLRARKTGKPLLVVFRCVPCGSAPGLDGALCTAGGAEASEFEGRIRAAGGKLDTLLTIIREGAKSRVTLPIR